jgi:hypothetical protein
VNAATVYQDAYKVQRSLNAPQPVPDAKAMVRRKARRTLHFLSQLTLSIPAALGIPLRDGGCWQSRARCKYSQVMLVTSTVARNFGGRRTFVACSNA